jgi:hypothetical protein
MNKRLCQSFNWHKPHSQPHKPLVFLVSSPATPPMNIKGFSPFSRKPRTVSERQTELKGSIDQIINNAKKELIAVANQYYNDTVLAFCEKYELRVACEKGSIWRFYFIDSDKYPDSLYPSGGKYSNYPEVNSLPEEFWNELDEILTTLVMDSRIGIGDDYGDHYRLGDLIQPVNQLAH